MKKIFTLLLFLLILLLKSDIVYSQNAWFNEFHYDDAGTDANEFIEIAVENVSNYTLSGFTITLYNGTNGQTYNTKTLSDFTVGATYDNITLYYFIYPTNGIENGAPDGFSLDYNGTVIQFLSYEGSFTATNGPANTLNSTDIGVSENGTPDGNSLQLTGTGYQYSQFTWSSPMANTMGSQNTSQDLPIVLNSFNIKKYKGTSYIYWGANVETNNSHFLIEWSRDAKEWNEIGTVKGSGTTHDAKEYSYIHENPKAGINYYRLTQVDFDGRKETFPAKSVFFESNQRNFDIIPNLAFNNVKIEFEKPVENGRLHIYNIDGQLMQTYVLASGIDILRIDISGLPAGQYIAKYIDGEDTINKKFIKQ